MTKSAIALGCAAVGLLLSAAACGTSVSAGSIAAMRPSATRPSAERATVRPADRPSAATATEGPTACPTRRAWATEVTATGHVAWQIRLPTAAQQQGIVLQPVVVGRVGVFAEENAVYGIGLADGRELWRRAFSKDIDSSAGAVYGLWPGAPGAVVVLTGQVTDDARLTELYPETGAVGWTLPLAPGLYGSQALAADQTLAVLMPSGDVESVDLVTGRVRWSRHVGRSAGPAAVGGVIASGGSGVAVGYLAQGGGRALWTARGLPAETNLTAAPGVLLAWSNTLGAGPSAAVTALNPRTGRVLWRFDPGPAVTILGGGAAGIAFATYAPYRLYLVNPVTGRIRWSVDAFAAGENVGPGQAIVTASQVITEGSVARSAGSLRLVTRSAGTGRVQWSAPLAAGAGAGGPNLALVPLAAGQAIAASAWQGAGLSTRLTLDRLATGRPLGAVTLPNLVMAPLRAAGASVLTQTDSPACAVAASGTAPDDAGAG